MEKSVGESVGSLLLTTISVQLLIQGFFEFQKIYS